jgi:PleD family two-component response regulator
MSRLCYSAHVSDPTRVLVAVGQKSLRSTMAEILRSTYQVIETESGAVDVIRKQRPDLVVLEPGADELDALRRDPQLPYIPVLLVSPQNRATDRVAGLRAGADDFVGVDVKEQELLARVDALLRVARLAVSATTPVPDATYLEKRLAIEFDRAVRLGEPLAVMVIDTGRSDPERAATRLAAVGRRTDPIARCDCAEVAVVLRNTHFAGSVTAAERAFSALDDGDGELTVWMGVGCYPSRDVTSADGLLAFACAALERARGEGRNVCVVQHETLLLGVT